MGFRFMGLVGYRRADLSVQPARLTRKCRDIFYHEQREAQLPIERDWCAATEVSLEFRDRDNELACDRLRIERPC